VLALSVDRSTDSTVDSDAYFSGHKDEKHPMYMYLAKLEGMNAQEPRLTGAAQKVGLPCLRNELSTLEYNVRPKVAAKLKKRCDQLRSRFTKLIKERYSNAIA
jgi:hypothetical protein